MLNGFCPPLRDDSSDAWPLVVLEAPVFCGMRAEGEEMDVLTLWREGSVPGGMAPAAMYWLG